MKGKKSNKYHFKKKTLIMIEIYLLYTKIAKVVYLPKLNNYNFLNVVFEQVDTLNEAFYNFIDTEKKFTEAETSAGTSTRVGKPEQ